MPCAQARRQTVFSLAAPLLLLEGSPCGADGRPGRRGGQGVTRSGTTPHRLTGLGWARGSNTAQRPRSKRRRGDAIPAPFCCPPPAGDRGRIAFVAAFTRRAQDITASYANPEGGRSFARCAALCIRRRYVKHRHNCQRSATRPQTVARVPLCQHPQHEPPANRERLVMGFLSRAAQW